MPVRLSDIASEAGVSLMTVSNVMNGKSSRVSEATASRVLEIADRLGYVPNLPARSLAASKSHIIAALTPVGEDRSLLMSPHTVEVIGGLEKHLRHEGYHVLLRGIEKEADIAGAIKGWALDGAILLEFADSQIDRIQISGVPLVAIDSYSENPRTLPVRTDDRHGGWLAGKYLTEAGHSRLLFAGPPFEGMGVMGQRWEGFRSACVAAGIDSHQISVAEALVSYEEGQALGRRLTRDYPDVTAVFATADALAIGILAGLSEVGVSVPEDISVIGFDNIEMSALVTPGLTTIAQDIQAKGAEAARLVLQKVEKGQEIPAPISLGVSLVTRASVASPRSS